MEFDYNPDHLNRRRINIALMVSKEDLQPEYHAVFEGSREGSTTVRNLIAALPEQDVKNRDRYVKPGSALLLDV